MASAPKNNAAAQAARIESAPDEALVAPRAVFVMPRGSAEDGETSSSAAEDAFAAALPVQQCFRSALEKGVAESRAVFAKAITAADETTSAFEVSFASAKGGALAINAKAFKAARQRGRQFRFLEGGVRGQVALPGHHAPDRVRPQAGQNNDQPDRGPRRADAEGDGGRRGADQGTSGEIVQDGGLILISPF